MLELEAEASCDAMGERVDESCLVGVGRWKPAADRGRGREQRQWQWQCGSGGGWLAMTRPGRWSARRQGNWKRQGREDTYRAITCTVAPLEPPVWAHREIQRHVVG